MARAIPTICEYTSDYDGEPRFGIVVDGMFPEELDFPTREEAEAKRRELLAVYPNHEPNLVGRLEAARAASRERNARIKRELARRRAARETR